jgi:hypothetical protein
MDDESLDLFSVYVSNANIVTGDSIVVKLLMRRLRSQTSRQFRYFVLYLSVVSHLTTSIFGSYTPLPHTPRENTANIINTRRCSV